MKQFLLKNEPDRNGIVRLEDSDYRYLVRVRRLAVGEFFPAVLPDGEEILVEVLSVEHGVMTGKCEKTGNPAPCEKLPPIILFQALPKGDKMDIIVRQAAEGGITEIVPFVSEFSVGKAGGTSHAGGQKFSRWERIINEARQQSGSKIATRLHHPLSIDDLIDYWIKIKKNDTLGILFHHRGLEQESLHGYLNINPKAAVIVIGPEGGFSDSEVTLFIKNGFKPLVIGDTILRTETAALYCAAAVKIILLERDSWKLNKQMKSDNV
ncbi:MAG: 16S rRNA (uracil(1498)-N(3))-methyltransferase [Treponema sp.]|nr:16S rRNA (uracil(1498)-N(3))-methyltransferase [Treponema sp.]